LFSKTDIQTAAKKLAVFPKWGELKPREQRYAQSWMYLSDDRHAIPDATLIRY
jgi:hypothetical protein